jgi:PAS domain-containing protein
VWQDRAARAPVYVLHRGRPRLALVALDVLDAMSASQASGLNRDDVREAMLDTISDVIFVIDDDARLVFANAAARVRFGDTVRPGLTLASISTSGGLFLAGAIARVLAGADAETMEIAADRFPERLLSLHIAPLPQGCIVIARDATATDELRHLEAMRSAEAKALAQLAGCATATIGLRGHLIAPDESLARLTGVATHQLASARFVTLIGIADRPAVGAAIEKAMAGGEAGVDAALLVRGAEERSVSIGFAPVLVAGRVEQIAALIVTH